MWNLNLVGPSHTGNRERDLKHDLCSWKDAKYLNANSGSVPRLRLVAFPVVGPHRGGIYDATVYPPPPHTHCTSSSGPLPGVSGSPRPSPPAPGEPEAGPGTPSERTRAVSPEGRESCLLQQVRSERRGEECSIPVRCHMQWMHTQIQESCRGRGGALLSGQMSH